MATSESIRTRPISYPVYFSESSPQYLYHRLTPYIKEYRRAKGSTAIANISTGWCKRAVHLGWFVGAVHRIYVREWTAERKGACYSKKVLPETFTKY